MWNFIHLFLTAPGLRTVRLVVVGWKVLSAGLLFFAQYATSFRFQASSIFVWAQSNGVEGIVMSRIPFLESVIFVSFFLFSLALWLWVFARVWEFERSVVFHGSKNSL